jgi:RimJ/RimL family protein N-acetyltransferase
MLEGTVMYEGKLGEIDVMIRYCRRDDVERLLEFINTASKEYTYIIFQGEQLTLEEESRYVEGYMKKIEDRKAIKLLVFHKDELIGVCDITPKEKAESHIGVFGLIIKKEWRGKGVGKLLMAKTLQEAEKNLKEIKIITLGVFANNPIAKRMYEKFGFKEYGYLPKGLLHRGELVDHIYMYKLIRPEIKY